jgi:hypothetical protein
VHPLLWWCAPAPARRGRAAAAPGSSGARPPPLPAAALSRAVCSRPALAHGPRSALRVIRQGGGREGHLVRGRAQLPGLRAEFLVLRRQRRRLLLRPAGRRLLSTALQRHPHYHRSRYSCETTSTVAVAEARRCDRRGRGAPAAAARAARPPPGRAPPRASRRPRPARSSYHCEPLSIT